MPRTVYGASGTAYQFPDDASAAEVDQFLQSAGDGITGQRSPMPARVSRAAGAVAQPVQNWLRTSSMIPSQAGRTTAPTGQEFTGAILQSLPYLAAMGASAGGASIPMVGLFGAGGEALRQNAARLAGLPAPETARGALGQIAAQGGLQTAYETLGRAGAGLVGGAARRMMSSVVRPSVGLQQEFGDIIGAMLREKLPVGKGLGKETGLQKVARLESESANALAQKINQSAAGRGVRATAHDIVNAATKQLEEIKGNPLNPKERLKVNQAISDFVEGLRDPRVGGRMGKLKRLTMAEVNVLKQKLNAVAEPLYKAQARGEPRVALTMKGTRMAKIAKELSGGARRVVEANIPEARAINARTKSLMGAKHAIEVAQLRPAARIQQASFTRPLSWPILEGLATPEAQSRLAIALAGGRNPIVPQVARGVPRGLAFALQQALAGQAPPDVTGGQ